MHLVYLRKHHEGLRFREPGRTMEKEQQSPTLCVFFPFKLVFLAQCNVAVGLVKSCNSDLWPVWERHTDQLDKGLVGCFRL